jgi:hypothetical protein
MANIGKAALRPADAADDDGARGVRGGRRECAIVLVT